MMFEGKREFLTLFRDKGSWVVSFPTRSNYFKTESVKSMEKDVPIVEMMEEIEYGVDDVMFSGDPGILYNTTFWDNLYKSLQQKFLKEGRSDLEVQGMLTPFLKEIFDAVPYVKGNPYVLHGSPVECYDSKIEDSALDNKTKFISGILCSQPVYKIAVGFHFHVPRFARDMSSCLRNATLAEQMDLGLLMSRTEVQFAFSPFCARVGSDLISLPIVLVSPKVAWREGTNLTPIVAAFSFLPNFQMKRIEIDVEKWKEKMGEHLLDELSFTILSDSTKKESEPRDVRDEIKALQDQMKVQQDQMKVQQDQIKVQQDEMKAHQDQIKMLKAKIANMTMSGF